MIPLLRYFLVGAAAAAVDFGVFAEQITVAHVPWYYAAVISFMAATLVNYVLSVRFVFKSGARFNRHQELALVFLVSGIGLVLNQAVLFILIVTMGTEALVAKIGATGAVFFWNYAARQKFVFRKA
jgi:putative flippase GtrA